VIETRNYIFATAAATGRIPQGAQIAQALARSEDEVRADITALAAARMIILAPNDGEIWAAPPFCGRPTGFRVEANGIVYWGLCIWDALGIVAALELDAVIYTACGDCGAAMRLQVAHHALTTSDGVVHFAVPARRFWENIAFT
jgi:hypothetical protein